MIVWSVVGLIIFYYRFQHSHKSEKQDLFLKNLFMAWRHGILVCSAREQRARRPTRNDFRFQRRRARYARSEALRRVTSAHSRRVTAESDLFGSGFYYRESSFAYKSGYVLIKIPFMSMPSDTFWFQYISVYRRYIIQENNKDCYNTAVSETNNIVLFYNNREGVS